jgi:hypothetical protein
MHDTYREHVWRPYNLEFGSFINSFIISRKAPKDGCKIMDDAVRVVGRECSIASCDAGGSEGR